MGKKDAVDAVLITVPETPVDYSTFTVEKLLEAIGNAYSARDMKLMGSLSKLYTKKEAEAEKAKKEALLAELAQTTSHTLGVFSKLADEMVDSRALDGAEGIWFAFDFGGKREPGINPSLKLVKGSARKPAGEGGGSGKSSYVACPNHPTADLLAEIGDHVYFAKDTKVTIDKTVYTMPAGMTFQEAFEFSQNGGWRNRVVMAVRKEAGVI